MSASSQKLLEISLTTCTKCFKITHLKILLHLPGTNELNIHSRLVLLYSRVNIDLIAALLSSVLEYQISNVFIFFSVKNIPVSVYRTLNVRQFQVI